MKKLLKSCGIVTIVAFMHSLAGCAGAEETPSLSGAYSQESFGSRTVYSFDGENSVTLRFYAAGFEVYSQEGTYEITEAVGDEKAKIALTFPVEKNVGEWTGAAGGTTSVTSTYDFEKGGDCIIIGTDLYNEVSEDAGQGFQSGETSGNEDILENPSAESSGRGDISGSQSAELPGSGDILDGLSLTLPEEYRITYSVTEGHGISRTYMQTMVMSNAGVALSLGDGGRDEKYVFEKLESGKYLMYQYDASGQYITQMISDAIREQIDKGNMTQDMAAVDKTLVSGYAARISAYFNFYESFEDYLQYEGDEEIGGFSCKKYAAAFGASRG